MATTLREKLSQLLSTEYNASLVGMAFPRAVTMETAMNGFRNSGLWPVDHFVFTDDNFAPSMVTDRPGTVQLERQTAVRTEYFSLSYAHAAKPSTPKQTQGYNRCIPVENINLLLSNCAERPRPPSGRNQSVSGVVLARTPHKDSLNRSNVAGF
jgi:hypothetical protein